MIAEVIRKGSIRNKQLNRQRILKHNHTVCGTLRVLSLFRTEFAGFERIDGARVDPLDMAMDQFPVESIL